MGSNPIARFFPHFMGDFYFYDLTLLFLFRQVAESYAYPFKLVSRYGWTLIPKALSLLSSPGTTAKDPSGSVKTTRPV